MKHQVGLCRLDSDNDPMLLENGNKMRSIWMFFCLFTLIDGVVICSNAATPSSVPPASGMAASSVEEERQALRRDLQHVAVLDQQIGIMSQEECLRKNDIGDRVSRKGGGGPISETDLHLILNLVGSPAPKNSPVNRAARHMDAMIVLFNVGKWGSGQARRVVHVVAPLLKESILPERKMALHLLGHADDPYAIPYIRPLLSDPNPTIRATAKKTLRTLAPTQ